MNVNIHLSIYGFSNRPGEKESFYWSVNSSRIRKACVITPNRDSQVVLGEGNPYEDEVWSNESTKAELKNKRNVEADLI